MTSMSLALLGSLRERKQSEVANIKSTSTGPKDGERLRARGQTCETRNGGTAWKAEKTVRL
jgi:hypothetical protein